MFLLLPEHHMCTMNSVHHEEQQEAGFKRHQKQKGKNTDRLKLVYSTLQFLLKMNWNLEVSFKLSPKVHSIFDLYYF